MRKQLVPRILGGLLALYLLPGAAIAQTVTLTVNVIPPAHTPSGDTLLMVGNQAEWGNWFYPQGRKMERRDNNTWSYTGRFHKGESVAFKITRGSWFTEAVYNGYDPTSPKIPFTLNSDTTLTLRPANWNDLLNRSITGTVRYHHQFNGTLLRYTRDVTVWLPPSYFTDAHKRYPVLYAHDGQNLFDASNAYAGEWHMDETADSLVRAGATAEFIIVGISNTKDRWVEYSGTPEGRNYAAFIVKELKPFIDAHYRTRPDKRNTAAIGSSMGGLISFYLVWWYPSVFSKAACLSSGFAYDDGRILDKLAAGTTPLSGARLYLDCGGLELDQQFLPANEKAKALLTANSAIQLSYRTFPDAAHNEQAWAQRLWIPLQFLFGK